jgi:hypothetical protein
MYQVNPEVEMDRLVADEEQDARDMNDEYAENEMFNIMVLSLVMGKYLAGEHDELLSEDGNGVIYAVVKKELSKDVDDKSNVKVEIQPPEYYMKQVHGGRKFHHGSKRTWKMLRAEFPGINIPFSKVVEFVEECPICQKLRIAMVDQFKPLIKHLKPDHHRRHIGVDQLSMTPADNFGHDTLTVIVDHFSKHVRLYVTENHAGQTLAQHLYDHYCTWGRYDIIITDPGSNLTSEDVEQLNK